MRRQEVMSHPTALIGQVIICNLEPLLPSGGLLMLWEVGLGDRASAGTGE